MVDKKKILIVDDERNIRLMVSAALGKHYTVLEAENGEAAVTAALHHNPALILMDIMMPGKDGLTALHDIKNHERTRQIPVIMMTGVGYEMNKRLAENLGASGYITKPVRPKELLESVNHILQSA